MKKYIKKAKIRKKHKKEKRTDAFGMLRGAPRFSKEDESDIHF